MADKTEQILVHLEYLKAGVDGVNERLDTLNGRTRKTEQAIAVLQDRSKDARKTGAKWGAGVGAAIAALIAGLAQALGAKP